MKYSNITHSILKKYDVDLHNGFLPKEVPLNTLPLAYQPWESLNQQMAKSLKEGSFCQKIAELPLLEVGELTNAEMDRAMLLLGAFGHAYVKEKKTNTIPKQIAIPWVRIAEKLQRLPILTHSSLSLHNWRLKKVELPFSLENLSTQISFTETASETWFFNATTNIEKIGAKAIPILLETIYLAKNRDFDQSNALIKQVLPIFEDLLDALRRMYEGCDPTVFFNEIRMFFDSFKDVRYEGTSPEIRSYPGGSAAQSSLLQFFDLAMGIEYGINTSDKFLVDMRNYMPYPHRTFLNFIEKGYNFKQARKKDKSLDEKCQQIVQFLIDFRNEHLKIVSQYIVRPARKSEKGITGTGGTNPLIFLKNVRNRTIEHKEK